MTKSTAKILSIVVPLYNESAAVTPFHDSLSAVMESLKGYDYEIIYCNDGSIDDSATRLKVIASKDHHVRVIALSRNFGKEIATTAGIHIARGDAILTIDGDGQHPVQMIPDFVARWEQGHRVVVGFRQGVKQDSFFKRLASRGFYGVFNRMTGTKLVAGATDFRLIDRVVQQEFARMTEHSRITRGLIDWLGYDRAYVKYTENPREVGDASYSFKKLFGLAIDSMVSLSVSPLYITAYIGAIVLPIAALLGVVMVGNAAIGDPLGLHATGGAYLMVLVLFLIGILLMSQGIIGLYLSHIHTETQDRPLFIVDEAASIGLHED